MGSKGWRGGESARLPPMWPGLNLVPRVLPYPPYGARERETLVNAGHVAAEQN